MPRDDRFFLQLVLSACVSLALVGCDDDPPSGFDAGPPRDAGTTDAGTTDAGATDAGPVDAGGEEDAQVALDAGVDAARPDAGPPPCPTSDLGSATGLAVVSGTLDLAGNQVVPSCAEVPNGEDLVYAWRAPSAGEWVFDTIGSDIDSLLAIHEDDGACPGAVELACNDDAPEAVQSALRITLTTDQRIYVVVDEYGVLETGDFQLNIHTDVPTTETSCDDDLDDDRDGVFDCNDEDCAGMAGCPAG